MLKNKLNITSQAELNREEERIGKMRARELYDSGRIEQVPVGTFAGLSEIHTVLFGDIYDFAGQLRDVNISKGNFRFAPVMYLAQSVEHISGMPGGTFDEIIEKYVEMNIAHPFREGNGRATRIWLDLMLKNGIGKVIDWNAVDKEKYMDAMVRSTVNDAEIKALLSGALTDKTGDRELFMQGIDTSYYYEGYNEYKTDEV